MSLDDAVPILAAYCLAALSGKKEPSANDIKTILNSVGIEPQDDSIKRVIDALKGKELHQVISEGMSQVG